MSRQQELQDLRVQINNHEVNISQMQELMDRTPSEPLRHALEAEVARRDAARLRLARTEEVASLETQISNLEQQVAQQEGAVQAVRDEMDAVQRRLTQAETHLNQLRIDMHNKHTTLQQKKSALDQMPAPVDPASPTTPAAPAAPVTPAAPAPPQAGGTVRLSETPAAVLKLGDGTTHALTRNNVTIGREAGAGIDIALEEPTMSGTHARVSYANHEWTVTDLGSTNGTWLNSQQLTPNTPAPLRSGSVIYFGKLAATFETMDGSSAP